MVIGITKNFTPVGNGKMGSNNMETNHQTWVVERSYSKTEVFEVQATSYADAVASVYELDVEPIKISDDNDVQEYAYERSAGRGD